jgi:hypothetical protein
METFVVRVWVPAPEEPAESDTGFRGILEDVGSHARTKFNSADELIALVSAALRARRDATDDGHAFHERKGT